MNELFIPSAAAQHIAAVATSAGADRVETGGFLLTNSDDHVTTVALTGQAGILRRRDLFAISATALDPLFDWTVANDLTVAAQWHSHRYEAFLSETDLTHGLNVPGFRTTVVPDYQRASAEPGDWGWWVFENTAWRPTPPPATTQDPFSIITFDAAGVR